MLVVTTKVPALRVEQSAALTNEAEILSDLDGSGCGNILPSVVFTGREFDGCQDSYHFLYSSIESDMSKFACFC